MKITSRGELALKAMIELARTAEEETRDVTAVEIAERCQASLHFLEQVLYPLRASGMVQSRRGRHGGYRLARDAGNITAGEIVRLMEGSIAPAPCGTPEESLSCYWCPASSACALRPLWADVTQAISAVLDTKSLRELAMSSGEVRGSKDRTLALPA